MYAPETMKEVTELFVQVLRDNPQAVVKNLNSHLETSGIELRIFTIDVRKKYAEARQEKGGGI